MKLTDNLQLPCPGPDDWGATALYMERLAREADQRLGVYEDEFNAFLHPPTLLNRTTSTVAISPNGEYPGSSQLWTDSGANSIFSNVTPGFGGHFPVPGWWHFGVADQSSTGTGDNQGLTLILEAWSTDLVPGQRTNLFRVARPYFDSNTSGEHGQVSGMFYAPAGVRVFAELGMYTVQAAGRTLSSGAVAWRTWRGLGDNAQEVTF